MCEHRARAVLPPRPAEFASLNEPKEPLPRLVLRLFARRWPVYLALIGGLFLADGAFHAYVHMKNADIVAGLIFSPLFQAAAILIAAHDASGTDIPIFSRFLERAWAVIIVVFISELLQLISQLGFNARDAGYTILSTLLLTFTAMLIYAPVDVLLGNTDAPLQIVPQVFATSLRLAWRNISRVFALFSILLGGQLITQLIILRYDLLHQRETAFWTSEPVDDTITIALAVIVTAAYVDLTRGEKKAPLVL